MSRVLLVDTNLAAWPIHEFLVAQGHEVHVVGGNPQDYLANVARHYVNLDYSDLAKMSDLIDRLEIEWLVPGCNDLSYAICAQLNEKHGFRGIDTVATTDIINHKEKFRRFARDNGVPVPALLSADEALMQCPVIVKPVDAFSGRGITVVQSPDRAELERAIKSATDYSRSGQYVIEKFVQGQLLSHSAFIAEERILLDFFVEEHCVVSPFAVDTSRVVSGLSVEAMTTIRESVEKMARLLKLEDGLFHTQFIMQEDQVWFVEVTRRCPGDLYSLLIQYSTGFHYAEMYAAPFVGLPLQARGQLKTLVHVVRHTVTQPMQSRFTALSFARDISLRGYFSLARSGDLIGPSPFGRIGIFFTESASREEQQSVFDDLIQRKLYVLR